MTPPVRVLVVDDSALVRSLLTAGLSQDAGIEVVGAAADPYDARDHIVRLSPDVMTLDVEMPRMNGVEFLRRLMSQHPLPVVMVSSLTQRGQQITWDALAAGAVDFVPKPSAMGGVAIAAMVEVLCAKVKQAAGANVQRGRVDRVAPSPPARLASATVDVIAIGSSTGGVEALQEVIGGLPVNTPGVVVAQHILPGFTRTFAQRLNQICAVRVVEASDGEPVVRGRVLVAPGDRHLRVERRGRVLVARLSDGPPVNHHRPAVDVLLRSVAEHAGARAVGVILTGMGCDGAEGLLSMRGAGAWTLAQDEASSVVYGMPKAAFGNGAAQQVAALDRIAGVISGWAGTRG